MYTTKAEQSINAGDNKNSILYADKIIKLDPASSVGYRLKGIALYNLDRLKESKDNFRKVNRIKTDNTEGLYFYALNCIYLKEYDSALLFLNKAIETKGSDSVYIEFVGEYAKGEISMPQLLFRRGEANYFLEKYKQAIPDFTFTKNKNYEPGESAYFLGLMYLSYGKTEKGCSLLKESLDNGVVRSKEFITKYCGE